LLVLKIALGIVLAFVIIWIAQVVFAIALLRGITSAIPTPHATATVRGAELGFVQPLRSVAPESLDRASAITTITFASVTSPVARGGTGQVRVTSAPNVTCSITVTYASGPSTAQGLGPKTTDVQGSVSWTWTIGTNTTRGTWPIDVRCGSASARATFVVQ
jgi:hypothetical protein